MPVTREPEVRSVAASKQEALRAILNSLVPNGDVTLPEDADVEKLAEKLDELLANKGGLNAYMNVPRDDQGRLLNEEGLPIMEIMEPVTGEPSAVRLSLIDVRPTSVSVSDQAQLSPLPNWALSPVALAARRRERDRILDMLEQEEEEEFARETAGAANDTIRNKVPPSAGSTTPPRTLDGTIRASKTEPNGLAFSSSSLDSQSQGKPRFSKDSDTAATSQEASAMRKPKKQKSVSFADPPADSDSQRPTLEPTLDWGDVIPVRINSSRPGSAKSHGVMKDLVVERPFAGLKSVPTRLADSDDEGDDEDLNEVQSTSDDEESEAEVPKGASDRQETSDEKTDGEEATVDADDTDFDEAMLQREIALAYYARRSQMGAGVTSGPLSELNLMGQLPSRNNAEEGVSEKKEVESNISHFRGPRLRTDPQTLINSAVQFGRVVDGQLVADETSDKGVSESVDELIGGINAGQEDMTEKMIELLRGGGSSDYSTDPKLSQRVPGKESIPSQVLDSKLSSTRSTTGRAPAVKSKPKSPIASATSNRGSSRQTAPAHAPQAPQPVIIESGFGFDPAFQIAPKPRSGAMKPVAPMAETVKERVLAPDSPIRGKGTSRFAQERRLVTPSSEPQLSVASASNANDSSVVSRDIVERPPSTTRSRSAESSKKVSRFRAERAGWL